MNSSILIGCLLAVNLTVMVEGHMRMDTPVSRMALHRFREFGTDRHRLDGDNEWCIDQRELNRGENPRNVTCGICGPVYNGVPGGPSPLFDEVNHGPTMFDGAPLFDGTIVATYKAGDVIDVSLNNLANHGGDHSFRICNADDLSEDPEMDCFDQNVLLLEDGTKSANRPGSRATRRVPLDFKVVLPEDLTCEHCILQWKWVVFRGTQQTYINCADIRITA